ncbi:MAG: hypothetical protein ACTSWM_10445 [Alphaproteobacteria bacterium]
MAQAQKYEFGTSFDPGAAEEELRTAPKYNDDDLAAARKQAYDEGHATGLAEVLQSEERRLVELLTAITGKADELAAEFHHQIADHGDQAFKISMLVCRKVLPALAERHGLAEIEALITQCLGNLPSEPRVVVRIDATNLTKLQERIDRIAAGASGFFGQIVLLADDDLGSNDCQVQWADGGAERNVEKLMTHMEDVINRHLNSAASSTIAADSSAQSGPTIKENSDAHQAPAEPVAVEST